MERHNACRSQRVDTIFASWATTTSVVIAWSRTHLRVAIAGIASRGNFSECVAEEGDQSSHAKTTRTPLLHVLQHSNQ